MEKAEKYNETLLKGYPETTNTDIVLNIIEMYLCKVDKLDVYEREWISKSMALLANPILISKINN